MERYRDYEEQSSDRPEADAFLHDNKHISRWADSRQLKWGGAKNALSTPAHSANASLTCCTLCVAPPALARIRGDRELDPQRLAAAGRVIDGGIHNLINGVEQAGYILQDMGGWDEFNTAFM